MSDKKTRAPQAKTSAVKEDDRPKILARKRADGIWLPPTAEPSAEQWETIAGIEWMEVRIPRYLRLDLCDGQYSHTVDLCRYENPVGVATTLIGKASVAFWNLVNHIKGVGKAQRDKRAAECRTVINEVLAGHRRTRAGGDAILRGVAKLVRGTNGIGDKEDLKAITEARIVAAIGEEKYSALRKHVEGELAREQAAKDAAKALIEL